MGKGRMAMQEKVTYEIMHGERLIARVDSKGGCEILEPLFLPCNLYLEEAGDVDTLVNNVSNFWYWCATRILTLDRQYAKEILGSIGVAQAVTDRDRAQIALSYRCVSLTDIYWVRRQGEQITFAEVNLYDNHLDSTLVDVALRGRQLTVQNRELAADLSTQGCFPKAWRRGGQGFELLKDGGREAVERELLASRVCRCFQCRQVLYEREIYEGEPVTVSRLMTSREYSIVSMEAFTVWAINHDVDLGEYILRLDAYHYYMMNLLDYLVGNTDRHWGNWGLLVDNASGQPLRLHDLMDWNQSFRAYDTLEGGNCQTAFGLKMTQQEAALEAVRQVGINQIAEIDSEWFAGREQEYEMLLRRLGLLQRSAMSKCHEKDGSMKILFQDLLNRMTQAAEDILGEALTGIYLHGSLAMGCFNPEKSDIDLIVVIGREMTDQQKWKFMEKVAGLNDRAPKKGLELSVVREEVCRHFVYPTPFELHFSPAHLKWWQDDPEGYIRHMKGTDPDLAAHFTIIRKYGIALAGAAVEEVFGEVPREAYLDSIRRDVENAPEDVRDDPVYVLLNLCRVAAYAEENLVLSKQQGGEWGLAHLPEKYHFLIQNALEAYRSNADSECQEAYRSGAASEWDMSLSQEFCREMLERVGKSSSPVQGA